MTTANHESPPGALEGLRVLDVAAPLGAFVSRILGDLGADVIKIEPPGGDPGRHLSPFLTTGQERLSLPFVHANVNKRSVILDLEQRQDQERFQALAAQSDVVVSTEGMATWAARGIDVERLSKLYPRLVWTSFSLFGLSGPYSAYTGNNIVAEAMGGLMYIQGDDARPPCVSPYEQGLYLASLHAACGTLLALWERRAGLGQVVEVCVQVLANLYFLLVNYGLWSDMPYRMGRAILCHRTATTAVRTATCLSPPSRPASGTGWSNWWTIPGWQMPPCGMRTTATSIQNWWCRCSRNSRRAFSAGR